MRFSLSLLAVFACGPSPRHPRAVEELRPRPSDAELLRACIQRGGNEVRIAGGDAGAPIVALDEVRLHGWPLPRPTVAIWPDGRIVFSRSSSNSPDAPLELYEGTIPPARVADVVRNVSAALRTVPRSSSVFPTYHVDGGQITTITVRTGESWLVARMYGAVEEDFLAAASDVEVPQPAEREDGDEPTVEADGVGVPFSDLAQRVPPPKPFARSYRMLLESRPMRGVPFRAHDHDIVFFAPDPFHVAKKPRELAWPAELPPPPRDLAPERCDVSRGLDPCPFILDPPHNRAAQRLREALRLDDVRPTVTVHGRRFMIQVIGRYEGERANEAVLACSRSPDDER